MDGIEWSCEICLLKNTSCVDKKIQEESWRREGIFDGDIGDGVFLSHI
jgi:hypothetical protein